MTKENQTPVDAGEHSDVLDDIIDEAIGINDEIDDNADDPRDENPNNDDGEEQDETELNSEDDPDGGDETGESEEESALDDGEPKKQSRLDKRIGKLTREKNDAAREAEYWRRKAQEAAATPQIPQATQEQLQEGAEQGLTPEQVQAYVNKAATELVGQERFNAKAETLRKTLTDNGAEDALNRLSNSALTSFEVEAVEALADSKYPSEVANAIAGNEELFNQFSSAPNAVRRAMIIARLDGRIEARKHAKPQKSQVKATPKLRGATRPPTKNPDDMSQSEYEAYAIKQGWM